MPNLLITLTALALISANALAAEKAPQWELLSDRDGIRVSRMETPGSSLIRFKGEAEINASPAKVLNIIVDTTRATEWVEDLEESSVVRWIKQPPEYIEYIEYNHIRMPPLIRDRDFVSTVKVNFDPKSKVTTITYQSSSEPGPYPNRYQRGDLSGSEFSLTPSENGKSTHFVGVIFCDPKGSLPKWLVNLFQKSWPRDTIEAIRKQAQKTDVQESPYLKALLQ
jgi:hypothetical protein